MKRKPFYVVCDDGNPPTPPVYLTLGFDFAGPILTANLQEAQKFASWERAAAYRDEFGLGYKYAVRPIKPDPEKQF